MTLRNIFLLVVCVAVCFLPGIVGSLFTAAAIPTWYAGLVKPLFNPPDWVFGPVWTLLYLLMGIALFLVLKNGVWDRIVTIAVGVFAVQLILNGLWSYLFFGLHSPGWALAEITVLWASMAVERVDCPDH
jgi:benzodiazapine receptor